MRIILAVDGSSYSEAAAEFLSRLPFGPDARIVVLHSLKDYLLPDQVDAGRDFVRAGRLGAASLVEGVRARLAGSAGGVSGVVREGDPAREIIEAAQEEGADLVVVGHRGLSGLTEFMLGSVSHGVLRHGDFSTLVVKRPLPAGKDPCILCCMDGSDEARHAVRTLLDMPFPDTSEAHVVSVVDMEVSSLPERFYPGEEFSRMMARLREHNVDAARRRLDEGAAMLKERFPYVKEHIFFGAPEAEILRASEEFGADLIVVGSKGLRGVKGFLLGSVSMRVVKHAKCSVLVARGRG